MDMGRHHASSFWSRGDSALYGIVAPSHIGTAKPAARGSKATAGGQDGVNSAPAKTPAHAELRIQPVAQQLRATIMAVSQEVQSQAMRLPQPASHQFKIMMLSAINGVLRVADAQATDTSGSQPTELQPEGVSSLFTATELCKQHHVADDPDEAHQPPTSLAGCWGRSPPAEAAASRGVQVAEQVRTCSVMTWLDPSCQVPHAQTLFGCQSTDSECWVPR